MDLTRRTRARKVFLGAAAALVLLAGAGPVGGSGGAGQRVPPVSWQPGPAVYDVGKPQAVTWGYYADAGQILGDHALFDLALALYPAVIADLYPFDAPATA